VKLVLKVLLAVPEVLVVPVVLQVMLVLQVPPEERSRPCHCRSA